MRVTPANAAIAAEVNFHEPLAVRRGKLLNGLGPPPETRTGIIACYGCGTTDYEFIFTRHDYVGRMTVSSKNDVPLYHELYYKCSLCGHTRIWGTEII